MLRYLLYAALAVMLGIAIMLLPIFMFGYSMENKQLLISKTEKISTTSTEEGKAGNITSEKNIKISSFEQDRGLTSNLISSFPYAALIAIIGLVSAIAISLLAKRILL